MLGSVSDKNYREVFMRDDLKGQGYSKEDEYFHRKDQELIAKLREKAEAERARLETENKKKEYWMRCPKCGSTLTEEKYGEEILVDRCTSKSCGGIFLDGGELEILLKAKASLLQRIFSR
jgi:pyruvate-formate lyase-activating enzyme